MPKKFLAILFSLLISASLCSCGNAAPSAESLLYELCDGMRLPAGEVYLMSATEGEKGHLNDNTAKILYGNDFITDTLPKLSDYALFLSSFPYPYEAAVFVCRSASDTDSLLALCLERRDTLSVLMRQTEYAHLSSNVRIFAHGKYVAITLSDNPELSEKLMRKALS